MPISVPPSSPSLPAVWIPRTGTLEQVLRMLELVAMSPAYGVEVRVQKSMLNPTGLNFALVDANGNKYVLDLDDGSLADTSWVHEAYAHVQLTDALRLTPPYPNLLLKGIPGSMQTDPHGGGIFRDRDFQGQRYVIEAITFANQDDPTLAQREALILARSFEALIRRNEILGGLVELIQPIAPAEPGGSGATKGGIVGAARQRLEVFVLAV